jgi:isopentenyl diphosphate isomerase/L-lactate dehydrogenase-like FMN-dependent dehydrogenase
MNRRSAFRRLMAFAAGSPLFAQSAAVEPAAGDPILGPVNVHEFEELAKQKLDKLAYDFIAGGVEDELTLRANRDAYKRWFLIPRVMTDVSSVDTSVEFLGLKLDAPIIIAPTGGKNLVLPNAESVMARAAAASKTLICTASGVERVASEGLSVTWWSNTTGQRAKDAAQSYMRRMEDGGAKGIVITVDNQYQSNRDRNNRNRFDYGYMRTGVPKPGDPKPKAVNPALPAMWQPHTPNMTWDYIDWLRGAGKIPILLKGVLAPEDAELGVRRGADAIIVSNHGGRQLDGVIATLDALPGVVDAVGGKVPVLMDGGIRRGSDILKALALGAKAVQVGRAPLWGLASFGQKGAERVLWMLAAELKLDMALAGVANLQSINRKMIRKV